MTEGVYDRSRNKRRKNLWVRYSVTNELRAQHGLKSTVVRESAGTGDKRVAESHLAQRKREIKAGTWKPVSSGGSDGLTVEQWARRWSNERVEAGNSIATNERQWLTDYVLPRIGHMRLDLVTREDVKRLMVEVGRTPGKRNGKPLAPRTVGHVYRALSRMFKHAAHAGLLTRPSPCTLEARANELPTSKDAKPGWRAGAIFTREEIETLISTERIPQYRRVLYALCALGGLRIGEAVGRRWRDYDATARPLGRLDVSTQLDGAELKTEAPRAVPVHPTLAAVLATWKLSGFESQYCKAPKPDEFIVQSRNGMMRPITAWTLLQDDLRRLGWRARRVHDMRRTFITLARTDGAIGDLLRFVTHGRSSSIMDVYTSPPWPSLCAEVGKLRLELPRGKVLKMREVK